MTGDHSNGSRGDGGGGGLVGFGSELCSFAGDGLEAGLDAGHGAAGMARLALEEVQTRVLLQDGVRGATRVTRHILLCNTQTHTHTHENTHTHTNT